MSNQTTAGEIVIENSFYLMWLFSGPCAILTWVASMSGKLPDYQAVLAFLVGVTIVLTTIFARPFWRKLTVRKNEIRYECVSIFGIVDQTRGHEFVRSIFVEAHSDSDGYLVVIELTNGEQFWTTPRQSKNECEEYAQGIRLLVGTLEQGCSTLYSEVHG